MRASLDELLIRRPVRALTTKTGPVGRAIVARPDLTEELARQGNWALYRGGTPRELVARVKRLSFTVGASLGLALS